MTDVADGGREGGIAIAVASYRRPDDLRALLPLLLEQIREVAGPGDRIDVLVVDNDPAGSARPVVDDLASFRVRYVNEPTPGIAAARNRALDEADDRDLLIFIDDDERPHPGWLRALLDAQTRWHAVAVAGAVVSDFGGELDPWIRAGDFFRRRRLPTGTPITVAATNNLLLDMAEIRRIGLRFDPRFGLSGGSDTLFTRQLADAGGPFVWCDEAVVSDRVPASRMTRDWVLRRAFRSGNSASRVEVALAGTPWARTTARARGTARGVPRVLAGAARWAIGKGTGSLRHETSGLRTAARGAGMLTGAIGVVYAEYGRPTGA